MIHRQDRQHVEQDRQFELVVVGVGDLGFARAPVRLAQRDVARMHLAAPDRPDAHAPGPEQQHECQKHLDEQRQQDGLDRHGDFPSPRTLAVAPAGNQRLRLMHGLRRSKAQDSGADLNRTAAAAD